MNLAYVRCSSEDQNTARQKEALAPHNIDTWYEEKISGKDMNRPELQSMLAYARKGDTIYVHDFSRLARSTKDLLSIIETLESKGINLVSNKENLDSSTATGKLMITVIAAINEFERESILDRQREGIAIAKRNGKYKGRKKREYNMVKLRWLREQYYSRQITMTKLAEEMGVSRPTAMKLLENLDKEEPFVRP